jgi:MFS family permease
VTLQTRAAALLSVPTGRDARIYAVASLVDALGGGLFLPIAALFFVKVAGLATTQVGIGLSITGVAGLLGPVLSGPLVDRYGARRVTVVLYVVRGVGYTLFPIVRGFWAFLAAVVLTGLADRMARPALQALVATLTDEADRVVTLAFTRAVRNIGYAVGALLVSIALGIGGKGPYVVLVLGDAATFFVSAVLMLRVRDVRTPVARGPGTGYAVVLRDRRFLALNACHGVLSLHLSILLIGFPLWIDQRTNAPTAMTGVIVTVNSLMVVLLQVPFSRRAVTVPQGGKAMRHCGFALAATCLLLMLTPGLSPVPAVVLLLVIGVVECAAEIWEAAGGWAVSLGLAPEAARGRYLGVWALGYSVHDIGGPVIMTLVVAKGGRYGLAILAAAVLVAGLLADRLAASVPGDAAEPLPQGLDALDDRVDDRDAAAGQP